VPVTARGQARRLAMIDAAKAVFIENGYERTTLDMVIARAGGSRRTLYECFGDKAGLFRAVVEENTETLLSTLADMPRELRTPRDVLSHYAKAYLDMVLSRDALALFRLMVAESPKFPELGEAFYQAGPLRLRNHLTEYLRRAHDAGQMQVPDALLAARHFFGLIKSDHQMSALLCASGTENQTDTGAHARAAVDVFLRGYRATVRDQVT
jgi:AcrR family transcriptional regulator